MIQAWTCLLTCYKIQYVPNHSPNSIILYHDAGTSVFRTLRGHLLTIRGDDDIFEDNEALTIKDPDGCRRCLSARTWRLRGSFLAVLKLRCRCLPDFPRLHLQCTRRQNLILHQVIYQRSQLCPVQGLALPQESSGTGLVTSGRGGKRGGHPKGNSPDPLTFGASSGQAPGVNPAINHPLSNPGPGRILVVLVVRVA